MKKLLILFAVSALGCSKDNLEPRPFEFGSIEFAMSAPKIKGTTAKVPSCKEIEPNEVHYKPNQWPRGSIYVCLPFIFDRKQLC